MRIPEFLKERIAFHEAEARRRFTVNSLGYSDSGLTHSIQHLYNDEKVARAREFVDVAELDEIVIQRIAYSNVFNEQTEARINRT